MVGTREKSITRETTRGQETSFFTAIFSRSGVDYCGRLVASILTGIPKKAANQPF